MFVRARRCQEAAAIAALAVLTALGVPGGPASAQTGSSVPDTPAQQCTPPAKTPVKEIPWAQRRLQPQSVAGLTTGQGITVAVVDTGVDAGVPQLAGHVLAGADVTGGAAPANTDCQGHGTFVAGIIAAQPVSGIGFAGVAPGVQILPIRQSENDGTGSSATMAAAITQAVQLGAQVINISVAADAPSADLESAVANAVQHNVVVVAAVANSARTGNPKTYPAAYPGVIAVGSVGPDGARSTFSETGSFVDLVAPGDQILSLGTGGPGHLIGQGTSFAAPFVAGVAALVRAYRPHLSAEQVKHRLEATADHPGVTLPDTQLGWGVVNPLAAVTAVLPEETGGTASVARRAPQPISLGAAAPADTTSRNVALLASIGVLVAMVVAGLVLVTVVRGRRRGWRSGRLS